MLIVEGRQGDLRGLCGIAWLHGLKGCALLLLACLSVLPADLSFSKRLYICFMLWWTDAAIVEVLLCDTVLDSAVTLKFSKVAVSAIEVAISHKARGSVCYTCWTGLRSDSRRGGCSCEG